MNAIAFKTKKAWRQWLDDNYVDENGIWLAFYKKHTGLQSISFEDAVEQALCYGWVGTTRQPATRRRRTEKAIEKLQRGENLGL